MTLRADIAPASPEFVELFRKLRDGFTIARVEVQDLPYYGSYKRAVLYHLRSVNHQFTWKIARTVL